MNELQVLNTALSNDSIGAYIYSVNQQPMLSAEEEVELAEKLQKNNDLEAAKRLVLPHLRFVVKVARGYSGYGLAMADLIQEGNIGLMKAVKRFDPSVGVRLVTFAVHWIKAEIHEFIIKNWRIVKVATTKAQRKLFFNLRKMKSRLGWMSKDEVEDVAEELGVQPKVVLEMEQRMNAYDAGFDAGASNDDDAAFAPSEYLGDDSVDPSRLLEADDWADQGQHHLYDALEQLDERSQDILRLRWLTEKKATLHELAAKYDVSAERIRQLEQAAMKKLRDSISIDSVA